ncbi:carboxypeptidase regulatory-like domain-containing protein [Spirosoma arcticum]
MKRLLHFLPLLLIGLGGCNEDLLVEPQQYGSISGQVLSKKDGIPVNKAAVRLSPSGRTVQTDTTGRFRFDTVLVGKYTIQASKEAFRDELTTVEVASTYGSATVMYLVNDNPPPTEPRLLTPAVSVSAVSTMAVLTWQSNDPNKDPLTYEVVILREGSTTPMQTVTGLKADSLVLTGLDYGTTYYWQVTVSDGVNSITGKTWSFRTVPFPDVAYVFTRKVDGRYQIFAAIGGGNAIALTHTGSNWRPVVSPNGKQIAFMSNAGTDVHLFVMNHDGSHPRRVTTVPMAGLVPSDLSFCWSPDGTQLLYPSHNKLYVVQADGSGNGLRMVSQAPAGRFFAGCDWTPQGNRIIARTTGSSIYDNRFVVMSPQGKDTITVLTQVGGRMGNPVFSTTGEKILFSYDKIPFQNAQGRQLNALIALLTLGEKQPQDVMTFGTDTRSTKPVGTNDLDPRFSPDGAKITFTNTSNTGTGEGTVMTIDFDGKTGQNRTVLIKAAEMPCWRSM